MEAEISLHVDGQQRSLVVDTRTSLLDALREHLGVTTAKKGCDHGQCGACTVLLNGRRVTSCLALAVAHDGAEVTTSDGLRGDQVAHPLHEAFLTNDAFQCGYCTPGQICSAAGMLDELKSGWPSAATAELDQSPALTDDEIRERMSGNLCRCGAYGNIVRAVREVSS
jgi:xanthine dehydrogenase YagT iron-sulfur-binding subunit